MAKKDLSPVGAAFGSLLPKLPRKATKLTPMIGLCVSPIKERNPHPKRCGVNMIKQIHIKNTKLFKDICIKELPETAKLVVLFGNNGTGKSTIFDVLNSWKGNPNPGGNREIFTGNFEVQTHRDTSIIVRSLTPYRVYIHTDRHQPIEGGHYQSHGTHHIEHRLDSNLGYLCSLYYDDFLSQIHSDVDKTVSRIKQEMKDKYFTEIKNKVSEVLDVNLELKPTEDRDEHLNIPSIEKNGQHYQYLQMSSGEIAVFDLLLDMWISKIQDENAGYSHTIFCIDEPESHIAPNLQCELLEALYSLTHDDKQLWISSHSIGIINTAIDLWEKNPEKVVFLNLNGHNFNEKVILTPSVVDRKLIQDIYKTTAVHITKFHSRILPIFCESDKQFDATCYHTIFKSKYPQYEFQSVGGSGQVTQHVKILRNVGLDAIGIIDRDNRSDTRREQEMQEIPGLRILSKISIEEYLLDDEVLRELCKEKKCPEKSEELINAKEECKKAKINQAEKKDGKYDPKAKEIAADFYKKALKILPRNEMGYDVNDFMKNILPTCIKPNMDVYKKLERDIFTHFRHR
ncbi:hypothetical protein C6499_04835 [Candidatus Poribacteria bacterium]|nr:MAG: hypothetical protein C6499_04835 [Candidatus Poribacteria bacterium]